MLKINVVIPFYNESENFKEFCLKLISFLNTSEFSFIITLIDDGSSDQSWNLIKGFENIKVNLRKIKLSRNFGHQGAIFAGLSLFKEDAVVILDGDSQDNPKYIPELIQLWQQGNDIVLANRIKRRENIFRRLFVSIYYYLQNKLSDTHIPKNVGHYSLLDKKIVNELNKFEESKKFLLGLRSFVGYKVAYLDVIREKRSKGTSKMTLNKLLKLSTEGLIGFSTAPLNIIGFVGLVISFLSIIFSIIALLIKLFTNQVILNWNFGLSSIYFLSGVQLLSLSVIGQYIAKIFDESKRRPQFIVEEVIEN